MPVKPPKHLETLDLPVKAPKHLEGLDVDPRSIRSRIEDSMLEKDGLLKMFEKKERVLTARAIGVEIARYKGTVMVWEIQDVFEQRYGAGSWRDENGKSYWAGAIFRGSVWLKVGEGNSPYNHNDSNKVWKLKI